MLFGLWLYSRFYTDNTLQVYYQALFWRKESLNSTDLVLSGLNHDILERFWQFRTVNFYVEEEEGGLFVVSSRSAEAPSTVWSSGTASCRPWRTALPRNAPAPADMRRRPRGLQILGRCRVSWARRASTPWWPFPWCHRRSDRLSRASSTSPRTCGVATKPERSAFPIYSRSDLAMFVSVASFSGITFGSIHMRVCQFSFSNFYF